MIKFEKDKMFLIGQKGKIPLKDDDEIISRIAMLYEGECEGIGAEKSAKKFGITRQRYYQLLSLFKKKGTESLKNQKTGPKNNYIRTEELVRQIIRYRFLDPESSAEVISQKLTQNGYKVSIRSVERVISQYGLLKKTSFI